MATAGYGMKFGKGYLGGSREKEAPMPHETEPENAGGDEEIKQHLAARHAATGHAHSHIEHHGDGRHTSHHISEAGEHSGPHEHESMDALHEHMKQIAGEGEPEHDGMEEGE